jgi:hypothetical protein
MLGKNNKMSLQEILAKAKEFNPLCEFDTSYYILLYLILRKMDCSVKDAIHLTLGEARRSETPIDIDYLKAFHGATPIFIKESMEAGITFISSCPLPDPKAIENLIKKYGKPKSAILNLVWLEVGLNLSHNGRIDPQKEYIKLMSTIIKKSGG